MREEDREENKELVCRQEKKQQNQIGQTDLGKEMEAAQKSRYKCKRIVKQTKTSGKIGRSKRTYELERIKRFQRTSK